MNILNKLIMKDWNKDYSGNKLEKDIMAHYHEIHAFRDKYSGNNVGDNGGTYSKHNDTFKRNTNK